MVRGRAIRRRQEKTESIRGVINTRFWPGLVGSAQRDTGYPACTLSVGYSLVVVVVVHG